LLTESTFTDVTPVYRTADPPAGLGLTPLKLLRGATGHLIITCE